MKRWILSRLVLLSLICCALPVSLAIAQPPTMAAVSPEVHSDLSATFRLLAPNARAVSVQGEFSHQSLPMAKDASGIWPVTTSSLDPNVYGYGFSMDGLNMPDRCNTYGWVVSLAFESPFEVPGASFLSDRNVPHGALHEPWYDSKELNTTRRVLVYTPPGYERGGSQRAIAGLSMGGYQALDIGLNNPQMFAYVAGMSAALMGPKFEGKLQSLLSVPAIANRAFKLLWLSCCSDDGLLSVNQEFEKALTAHGIIHEWRVTPGYAHWWTLWRANLRDLMPKLFVN